MRALYHLSAFTRIRHANRDKPGEAERLMVKTLICTTVLEACISGLVSQNGQELIWLRSASSEDGALQPLETGFTCDMNPRIPPRNHHSPTANV